MVFSIRNLIVSLLISAFNINCNDILNKNIKAVACLSLARNAIHYEKVL